MNDKKQRAKDYYVDNKKFTEEYLIWKKSVNHAKENGLPRPKISEYLGECILKICTRMTYMPSFYNYSWKDTMITNALENCIIYFDRFDENAISKRTGEKTAGPFSYFSTIVFRSFQRTIKMENDQIRLRQKYISQLSPIIQEISETETEEYDNEYITYLKNLLDDDFAEYDEKRMGKKKKDVDTNEKDDIITHIDPTADDLFVEDDEENFYQ